MNKAFNMYKDMQARADVTENSKKELVIKLYEAVIKNLEDANKAINEKNIPVKLQKIDKVLSIIELGLIMSLSKEGAKEVAENLELFYEDASSRIVMANITNDTVMINNVKESFNDLKKCWMQVAELS